MTKTERLQKLGFRLLRPLSDKARTRLARIVTPTSTIGCGAILLDAEHNVLEVKAVYRRQWGLPGGLVDRNELPSDAVIREVREETGVEVTIIGAPVVAIVPVDRRVEFVYPVAAADTSKAHAASPEIHAVRWRHLSELQQDRPASSDTETTAWFNQVWALLAEGGGLLYGDEAGRFESVEKRPLPTSWPGTGDALQ